MTRVALSLLCALVSTTAFAVAQDAAPAAKTHTAPVPDGVAAPVAAMLAAGGVHVTVGKATLDFWWVKALTMNAGTGPVGWADVEEGALVGALKLDGEFRDIRARIIKPGIYTLRFGLQPDNGDHLGVSPFREFLLISPSALDSDPAPRGHEGTVEISKEAVGGSHPTVLSIDPPVANQDPLQIHQTQLDHQAVVMEIPIVRDGKPAGTLRFGLVLVGKIEA